MKGEYPCRECGIKKGWSIFCEEEKTIGYQAYATDMLNSSEIDGCNLISYQALADRSYKIVVSIRVNGSGEVKYVEKLK